MSRAPRWNVVFICIDDLNDWCVPFGGHAQAHTPQIARLARRGVAFQRAYCNVPSCGPSRAATLTGISPLRSSMFQQGSLRAHPALRDAVTLPQRFRAAGYRTLGGGKVFHGEYRYGPAAARDFDAMGQHTEWDEYHAFSPELRPPSGPNHGLPGPWDQFDWSRRFSPDEAAMSDHVLAVWAAEHLARDQDAPFFLAVGLYRPHLPWYVPQKYYGLHAAERVFLPSVPANGADPFETLPAFAQALARLPTTGGRSDHERLTVAHPERFWREAVQGYLASVSFADACVGRLLDALDAGPHRDQTVVVLWSDNGFMLGQKRAWRKFKLWEPSARVPLVIAVPDRRSQGSHCRRTVTLLDLYPTLTDLCLGDTPAGLDGRSLVPLLDDPEAAWSAPAVTSYVSVTGGRRTLYHSVRTERWRLIRYPDGSQELYDHGADPQEGRNLLHPRYAAEGEARRAHGELLRMLP